ncbi:MAG: Rieske 2Fe-2S domain-containing protein, partial [Actinobacteria bacterium]|nr:Rieske 2Fe-2S domain-containing protein [Actinomycetota bacterium]
MTEITSHDPHGQQPERLGYSPVADVPHALRMTDTDPKAARRAERQVASMFLLSMLLTVAFVVAYFAIDKTATIYIPVFGDVGASTITLGFTLGAAIFLIGAGAIQWAKKLMPDVEVVANRHEMASPAEGTNEAVANYQRGKAESGFAQYKIIRRTLIGAMALFPIPLIIMLRDLWTAPKGAPSPADQLSVTLWHEGLRIVTDPSGLPIKPEDLPVGGLVSAVPADLEEVQLLEGNQNARTKAAIILVRIDPSEIRAQQGDGWDYQGIVAYSKICTHVGCPVGLYEQQTHHLLCPCHQSTFDVTQDCKVIFGP